MRREKEISSRIELLTHKKAVPREHFAIGAGPPLDAARVEVSDDDQMRQPVGHLEGQ